MDTQISRLIIPNHSRGVRLQTPLNILKKVQFDGHLRSKRDAVLFAFEVVYRNNPFYWIAQKIACESLNPGVKPGSDIYVFPDFQDQV